MLSEEGLQNADDFVPRERNPRQRGRIPIIFVLFSNGRSQNADGFVLRGSSARGEGFLAANMGATYPRKKKQ